jgi:hypothetical protein
MEDYPYLNYNGLVNSIPPDSSKMVNIKRDQEIKKLLSIRLI